MAIKLKLPDVQPELLLNTWKKFQKLPGGQALFSKAVGVMIPYSGSVGARVEELSPGFARVRLKDRRPVRNHLNSIHAMALANLGELATGLALNTALPPGSRAILANFEVTYVKKARGTLSAECRLEPLTSLEKNRVEVRGTILDSAGDEVAQVIALWQVGKRK